MRLIDADALPRFGSRKGLVHSSDVDNAPTIDADPVRHGQWIDFEDDERLFKCSACGEIFVIEAGTPLDNGYNYCPSCGAKMSGGRDEE